MADYSAPKRGVAFRFTLSLFARSDNQIKTAPTLAAGDVKVSKDNGATANITTLPSEAPASSGILQVDLSATEMTADLVTVIFRDAAGAEWNDVAIHLAPSPVQMGDLATAANLTVIDDLIDTEVAAIKSVVDAILVDTAEIGAAGAGLTALATQASVNTIDDFLDTEVAAIKAKTDNLPSDPADASDIASSFSTVNSTLSTIAGYIDTEVSTIVTQTSAASIRTAVGLASANLDTQIGTLATYLDTEIAAILADTNELQTDWANGGRLDLLIDAINAKTTSLPSDPADASVIAGRFDTLDTSVADLPTNAELATALAAADDAVLAAIAALNNLSAAQVNAEVVDALATDTYAEPGQGTPGATISLAAKVNYIYKALRNKSTVTATEHSIFNDDAVTVDHKRTISDDATTFTSGELTTGP